MTFEKQTVVIKYGERNLVLRGVSVVTLGHRATVPSQPVEAGFTISDHVFIEQPSFDVQFVLTSQPWEQNGEYRDNYTKHREDLEFLRHLFTNGLTFTFIAAQLGSFENCVFEELEVSQTPKQLNSFQVRATIKQIRRAYVEEGVLVRDDSGMYLVSPISPQNRITVSLAPLVCQEGQHPEDVPFLHRVIGGLAKGFGGEYSFSDQIDPESPEYQEVCQ